VALSDDVSRIAAIAGTHAAPGEDVAAVLAVESARSERLYLTAFATADSEHRWLALTENGQPVTNRERVREAASIAALVEVAEDAAERMSDAPRVASLTYLDSIGGDSGIAAALAAVEELTREVERNYKLELD
jgi:hypothetical protein